MLGVGDAPDHLGPGGAAEIDHQRQDDADDDGLLQLDGQSGDEGGQQDGRLGAAGAGDLLDVVKVDEPPGHQEQDAGHGRVGQPGRQGGDQQDDQGQQEGGEDRGQGRLGPGGVIETRAVEGAGGDIAGEEAADQVGQPLADEFLVAIQMLAGA